MGNHRRQSQQSWFSWGSVSAIDSKGRTIWIVDAHRCFKSQPGDCRQVALSSARKRPSFRPGGTYNTALGWASQGFNVIGNFNTGVGAATLLNNTADRNTATGAGTLLSNTSGFDNTANGAFALFSNTTGSGNTANGLGALPNNTTGSNNVALGINVGISHITGDNNLYLHNEGVDGENNTIRLGSGNTHTRTFIAAIRGRTTEVNNAIPVYIDSESQLGTLSSSRRFKKEIKPMDHASEAILGLEPVMFHYKSDASSTPQFGLIAEELAKVNPDLVVRDENGEIYTVRYDAVNAMLLNEFLKEHRKVHDLEATIARQQREFQGSTARQQKQIEVITTGLQKVSAQRETSKPAPQVVENNR